MQFKIQFLSLTCHISSAQKLHVSRALYWTRPTQNLPITGLWDALLGNIYYVFLRFECDLYTTL